MIAVEVTQWCWQLLCLLDKVELERTRGIGVVLKLPKPWPDSRAIEFSEN
jgi:hypothetical protein